MLRFHPYSWIHPSLRASKKKKNMAIESLPNELLSGILRYATLEHDAEYEYDSLAVHYPDPFILSTYRFTEYVRAFDSLKTKLSLSLVCKHWNAISAPFRYEYIYCTQGARVLKTLAASLEKTDVGIRGNRGQWVRRVDISFATYSYNYGWSVVSDLSEETHEWSKILALSSNARIIDVCGDAVGFPGGWTFDLLFSFSRLKHLTRMEWHAHPSDLSDLQQLSLLLPNLTHLSFILSPIDGAETLTDAFTISFPRAQVLILEWNQTEISHWNVLYPPFQPWDLPSLRHFGYFLRGHQPFHIVNPVLVALGTHLQSLELPVLGNELITLPETVLGSLPRLHTFLFDVFKTVLPLSPCPTHRCLRTLGWRLRTGSALHDIRSLAACLQYFNLTSFPELKKTRIVHPRNWTDYSSTTTPTLIDYWGMLVRLGEKGLWVPIVDFDDRKLDIPGFDDWGAGRRGLGL